ncbi:hypothetical protein D3C72_2125790 [compost metagenome]
MIFNGSSLSTLNTVTLSSISCVTVSSIVTGVFVATEICTAATRANEMSSKRALIGAGILTGIKAFAVAVFEVMSITLPVFMETLL